MAVDVKILGNAAQIAEHNEEEERREHLMLDPKPREEMNRMVIDAMTHTSKRYWITVGVLAFLVAVCLFGAWGNMIATGNGVLGIRRPVYWGVLIVTFVFWIGISHAGTFVSAILRVFKAEYRRPFTRAAELMTTFGLAAGALYPLIHLGRVWVFYWMIPYPNARWLWPNFRSPLVWDFLAITTYLLSSTIYLYLPLVPDLAMARDRHHRMAAYHLQAAGAQLAWHRIGMAPPAQGHPDFCLRHHPGDVLGAHHRLLGLRGFAGGRLALDHLGPYFIVGAILSGVSAVVTILFILQKTMKHMDYFIRREHFNALGILILVFSMAWAYFFFNEYILHWYGGEKVIEDILTAHATGPTAWIWYLMLICNVAIPCLTLWNKRIRTTPC